MALNGKLPASALSRIPGGRLAKGGPARSYLAMRYFIGKKSGIWLRPTGPNSSYRDYATQVRFWNDFLAHRGPLSARPGTSNHGVGRACDLPTPAMQMKVRQYGHKFGWGIAGGRLRSDAPTEPWHMTFHRYTATARVWYWRYRAAQRRNRRRKK